MALHADYRAFVAAQGGAATLWHDAEFLEAAIAGDGVHTWDYLTLERDGRTVAVLPFCRKRRLDGEVVTMPPLIRYGGPLFDAEWLAHVDLAKAYQAILLQWSRSLRSVDQVWAPRHDFSKVLTNLPIGYKFVKRTTYEVNIPIDEAALKRKLNKGMRHAIRDAAKRWKLITGDLTEEVHKVLETPFTKYGLTVPYDRLRLNAIFDVLSQKGWVSSHQALNEEGQVVAASVAIRDSKSAYCLVGGSSVPDGGSYTLWEDLRWAANCGLTTVDFLGSDIPSIASNRRRLGGTPRLYAHLYQDNFVWTRSLRWWHRRRKI